MAQKTSVDEKVTIKPGDSIDMQPKVKEALAIEAADLEAARRFVEEVDSIQAEPQMPRWGGGRLTIATPGDMVDDPSYIPDVVELRSGGSRRVACHRVINGQLRCLTADSSELFRWCKFTTQRISIHKGHGYRFARYSELFEDTGLFEKGEGDVVRNGDLVLMKIPLDGLRRLIERRNKVQAAYEQAVGQETFEAGTALGVPTFRDDFKRGVREFYT